MADANTHCSTPCPSALSRLGARALTGTGVLLLAAGSALAATPSPNQGAMQAMFATKAEAEQAAKAFNCTGAHRMGEMWMPCASHVAGGANPHAGMGH